MSNIHILTNPLSGKNRKYPTRFDKMMSAAKRHCATENTLTTHQPHGLDALLDSIQSMKESGADILCIDGGDGTIHQAFTALWKVYGMTTPYPTIALLKGGTMNNIARNVGVGFLTTAESLLKTIAESGELHTVLQHPLVLTNDSGDERSGFIYGNVALAPFMAAYYEGSPPSPLKGFLMFCRVTLSSIFGGAYAKKFLAPVSMVVSIDGEALPAAGYTLAGVSTIADVGFYCRPFYSTLKENNILQMLGMTCSPIHIVKVIPQLWFAKPTKKPYIKDIMGSEICFQYSEPHISTIDGDVYPPQKVDTIRVGPPVQFLHL